MSKPVPELAQVERQLAASLSRRRFLKTGLIIGTGAAAVITYPSRALAAGVPVTIHNLSETEYLVFDKLRTVLLPTERFSELPSTTQVPVMENLDHLVGRMNNDTRFLLALGIKTLEYSTLYKFKRFSSLSNEQATHQVHSWQTGLSLQGGLIVNLKTLLGVAYWRDPRTWQALEYDGPVTAKWGIRRLGNMPLPHDNDLDTIL